MTDVDHVTRELEELQLDRPWWYKDAVETREEEDPNESMEWELEFETPIVPNEAVADVLRNPTEPLPWWATRDGGFSVRDRGMRIGYKDWDARQKDNFSRVQQHFYVLGYYHPAKKLWSFEDIFTFCSEGRCALAAIDHPKARRWVRTIDEFLAGAKSKK
jgi:hypothetical protein